MTTNLIKISPTTAQTIDLTPSLFGIATPTGVEPTVSVVVASPEQQITWEFAAQVYLAVLENPSAPHSTKIEAKEEILKLALIVDNL